MKKHIALSLFLAFAATAYMSAQDLEKILENHFKAIGQDKLLKIETIEATGKAFSMGMETKLTMLNKRPNKIKVTIDFQGNQIIQAYDGETAWMINPMAGLPGPVELTGAEAAAFSESSDMDGQLWNYQEKGHQLELAGTEKIDDDDAYVLKLTKNTGNTDHYYLNKDSYLIMRVKSTSVMNGSEVNTETNLSDYRKVKGYMMPYATSQVINGQPVNTIIFEEVKVNEGIDDAVFSKPENN